jgi:hypothetical protein
LYDFLTSALLSAWGYVKPSLFDSFITWTIHLLTFFLDPARLAFFPLRTFRTLGVERTFLGDLERVRLTFFPVDFLARGIFNNNRKKKLFFFIFEGISKYHLKSSSGID